MAIQKVQGLLEYNVNTRNRLLRMNNRYSQYDGVMEHAIGENAEIKTRNLYSLTNNRGLFEFTHDGNTEYGNYINFQNFVEGREKIFYQVEELTPEQYKFWNRDIQDYTQYLDEIFGQDVITRHINYVNDLLANGNIENALRQNEVGVVRDINVALAKQGIATTNNWNFSGLDTRMGMITNRMYGDSLYYGALVNSDRQITNITDETGTHVKTPLTPSLINQYSNNLSNVFELSDMLSLKTGETRIREELGADVHLNDFNNNGGIYYLYSGLDEANRLGLLRYTFFKGEGYFYTDRESNRVLNDFERVRFDVPEHLVYQNPSANASSGKFNGEPLYLTYNERDLPINEDIVSLFEQKDKNGKYINHVDGENLETFDTKHYDTVVEELIETENEPNWESYQQFNKSTIDNTLLTKTNALFNAHKISTLIGRFHTSDEEFKDPEFIDTARSAFGNSHGRNLLVRDAMENKPTTNGYSNPYCRTWTYHHQYNQMKKLIRPFITTGNGWERFAKNVEIQDMNYKYRAHDKENSINGGDRLGENTVLQDNGLVRITPSYDKPEKSIKDCMFSIENLAWKDWIGTPDKPNLSKEQIGPNGGRIMWFPPYDLNFNENVSVSWNENNFIGRGEKLYTYSNTDRSATLSFSMLIDHPSIINSMANQEGRDKEKDINADILRFFAGCEMPEEGFIEPPVEEKLPPEEKPKPEPETKEINFKVYFPNNFSGVMTDKSGKNFKQNTDFTGFGNEFYNGFDDDLWWIYLLTGRNTCLVDYNKQDDAIGYEMGNGSGITTSDIDKKYLIYSCRPNTPGVVSKDIAKECKPDEVGSPYCYRYHVDDDLKQVFRGQDSYYDETSSGLNCFIDGDRNDGDYTFAEFILAVIESKSQEKFVNLINMIEKCVDNTFNNDKFKEFRQNVDKLKEIFGNTDTKYVGMSYCGGADVHDKGNSDMLATRRAYVIKRFVETYLFGNTDVKLEKDQEQVNGDYSQSPSNITNKKARCCSFKITYNPAMSEKLSDTDSGTREKQEDSGVTITDEEKIANLKDALINFEINRDYDEDEEDIEDGPIAIYEKSNEYLDGILDKRLRDLYLPDYDIIMEIFNDDSQKGEQLNIYNEFINNAPIYNQLYNKTISKFPITEISKFKDNSDMLSCFDILQRSVYQQNGNDNVDENLLEYYIFMQFALNIKINPNEYRFRGYQKYIDLLYGEYNYFYDYYMPYYQIANLVTINRDNVRGYIVQELVFDESHEEDLKEIRAILSTLCPSVNPNKLYTYQGDIEDLKERLIELGNAEDEDEFPYFYLYGYYYGEGDFIGIQRVFINEYKDRHESLLSNVEKEVNEDIRKEQEAAAQEAERQRIAQKQAEEEAERLRIEKEKNSRISYHKKVDEDKYVRYETEAEYFKTLEANDPVIFKSLKDKFKHFDPAFHSLSPEGFNARLNFLQQCTRQGATMEARNNPDNTSTSSNEANVNSNHTAANLAFGRMPVCVIRIGDFINTRAIITSVGINYGKNGMQWDLNPEGAGVQPMFAEITMGIKLLGGQSLQAPVTRLQNALSFNYYANTEAYDNRSDVASYSDANDYSVVYNRIWQPFYEKTKDDTNKQE